jgi:hypothetical protein
MGAKFAITDGTLRIGSLSLELSADRPWDAWRTKEGGSLLINKEEQLLRDLDTFFANRHFKPHNVFELGIWDGGSTAFWFEYFEPTKLVAVDSLDRADDLSFSRYIRQRRASSRLKTYWNTDQADRAQIEEIVTREFDQPLDLIIDDASHELQATSASFDTLFPRLSSDGIYVIEDWRWEVYPWFREPDHPWADRAGLVKMVKRLVDAAATGEVKELMVSPRFVAAVHP